MNSGNGFGRRKLGWEGEGGVETDGCGVLVLPPCPGAGVAMQGVEEPSAGRCKPTTLDPGDSHSQLTS